MSNNYYLNKKSNPSHNITAYIKKVRSQITMSNSQSMWEYDEIESFSLIPELTVGRWGEFATESKSNAKKLKNRRVRLCDWVRLWERGDGEPSGTGEQWSTEWERADECIGWDTLGFCYFG